MQIVEIQAFKDDLSKHLRRVDRGEVIQITQRGRVVAEVRPPAREWLEGLPPELQELVRCGRARCGRPNDPALYPQFEPALSEGTAQELLDDERRDR